MLSPCEPFDQTGTVGLVSHIGFAPDGLGGENVSHRASSGATRRTRKALNMHELSFEETVQQIMTKDSRYRQDAYHFLRDALDHTKKTVGKKALHVTGQQLLAGIREFGLNQFGPMALTVFEEWGIKSCKDFGEIVFNLVDNGVLAKTESDSRADFADGYNFWEAFRRPFVPSTRPPQTTEQADGLPNAEPEQTPRS